MNTSLESLLQQCLQKGVPIALSFLDDVLLLLLSNIGIHLPWLQWLCSILLICTWVYWIVRFLQSRYARKICDFSKKSQI
jgi:hypothetical protein